MATLRVAKPAESNFPYPKASYDSEDVRRLERPLGKDKHLYRQKLGDIGPHITVNIRTNLSTDWKNWNAPRARSFFQINGGIVRWACNLVVVFRKDGGPSSDSLPRQDAPPLSYHLS